MTYTPNITGAVHTNIQHDSAIKHVTGKAHYIDDLPLPEETQETALFLSPHAHAKIISIFRNPIDRAYSNYNVGKRAGTSKEFVGITENLSLIHI